MKSQLLKGLFALICLGVIAIPLSAQKGKGGGGAGGGGSTSGSCAVVATPILSTTTASAGINVGVFSRVGNCSGGKKRYVVTVSAISSCGEETVIASPLISFEGGQYKLVSTTYAISPDTCPGLSKVVVSVSEGGTTLATDSTTLTIQ